MRGRWAAALLAACVLLLTASAALADDERIVVSVQQVQGSTEGNVALSVDLSGCRDMDSLQLRLNYDQTALRLVSAEIGALLDGEEDGTSLYIINADNPGVVALAYAGRDGLTGEGTALTLTFAPYTDQGSAVVATDVLATRYHAASGEQSKAFVSVQNGGVYVGESGTIPDPVVTPWPEETPTPSPSPTPVPTPEPIVETTATGAPQPLVNGGESSRLLVFVLGGIGLLLVVAIVVLVLVKRRAG